MAELRELYQCAICGNMVEVTAPGGGTLVCCNQAMDKISFKTEESGQEKHLPIIEENEEGILVKVGSIEHPMEERHFIQFIEVLTSEKVLREELKAGQKPEAQFAVKKDDVLEVREFCNLHGVWKM